MDDQELDPTQVKEALIDFVVDDYKIVKALGAGAFGAAFEAEHIKNKTKACIKVALGSNRNLRFEAATMQRLVDYQRKHRTRHLCRIYENGELNLVTDKVTLKNAYITMEFAPGNMVGHIAQFYGYDFLITGCDLALKTLNGLYNLHSLGIIHRDFKAENVGMRNDRTPVILDFGLARIVSDRQGNLRNARSKVAPRGTSEWASWKSEMGFEQGYVDDLFGWLYTMAELFYHNDDKNPLPWAEYEAHFRLRQMMKTTLLPANLIYRNMPNEFYRINAYLHTLDRVDAPDYRYIILDLLRAKQKYIILRNRALNKLEDANEYTNEKTSKLDPLCPTVESNELLERYYDEIEGIFDNEFGDPDLDLN